MARSFSNEIRAAGVRQARIGRVECAASTDSFADLPRDLAHQLDAKELVPAQQIGQLHRELGIDIQIRPQVAIVDFAINITSPATRRADGFHEALTLASDRTR